MNVLVVCDVLGEENNGTTIAAMNLIRYLKSQGENVRVLCCDKDKIGLKDYFVVPTRSFGFIIDAIIKKNQVTLANPKTKIIKEALKDIDIVHCMIPFALGKKTLKIARKMGIPVTVGFHCQAENFSAHIFNFMRVKSFNNYVYKDQYKHFYKHANAIHYPTQFIKNVFESTVKRKTNGYVISNGVNEMYQRQDVVRTGEFSKKYNILFIGRISKEKSHPILLKAVSLSKYKDDIQLIFAGKGPREKGVRKLEKKYKLNPVIMDFYSRKDLIQIINSSDLYVHPSEIEIEAISCLEAIKCGLVPVISDSKKSATNAFALDERNLFKWNSPSDLAKKIDYWIEHPEEKEECSKRYLNYANNFSQTECMRQMHNMLKTYAKDINHTSKKTYYYKDPINDDFALNGIKAKPLKKNFKYIRRNPIYKFFEFILYFIIAKPLVWLMNKIIYKQKIVNHLTVRKKDIKGSFIYANHTQDMADAYTPNLIFKRKNNIIVGREAFSIPGIRSIVQMLGGIPLANNLSGMIKLSKAVEILTNKGQSVTIYPEAHIWPYYTKIRPFTSASFRYPVICNKPVICVTNTYEIRGKKKNKYRLVTHIDGPFIPDMNLSQKAASEKLRDDVYNCMLKRSEEVEQFEKYKYIDLNTIDEK
jgi:glycosyltransferase involved in cell wall biosynthesis/1-acyl-sn-glycerol-3-phosphate acyltransferase